MSFHTDTPEDPSFPHNSWDKRNMQFSFDENSEHQTIPVERVCQVVGSAVYSVNTAPHGTTSLSDTQTYQVEESLALREINNLREDDTNLGKEQSALEHMPRKSSSDGHLDLSIEMETGTGKTYTYLKTIFALNEQQDLRSFVIVVPSVAIREGVYQTINDTKEHFAEQYAGKKLDAFIYSGDPNTIRNFSNKVGINVMIITLDSFNKTDNILRREDDERAYGRPLIEMIASTQPIVILDEPQNMGSEISQEALDLLNPLVTLRYSATHKNPVNLIYRLTPAEARSKGLVKTVEVVSMEDDYLNRPYIKLLSIKDNTNYSATLEIEKFQDGEVRRKSITIPMSDRVKPEKLDLYIQSGERDVYAGWRIIGIDGTYVEFNNGVKMKVGEEHGVDREVMFRAQIRETIQNHIQKIRQTKPFSVKPLSLFFIDKVASWIETNGIIRSLFSEEFESAKSHPNFPDEWQHLTIDDVTEGYFSYHQKKDGTLEDLIGESEKAKDTQKKAYDLIMKGKKDLLSFSREGDDPETKRRRQVAFIFSHSALREGWDNPNVFTICTLAEASSVIRKRQEIGRGIRLPVDQSGQRIRDENLNILSVIANQSYESFVKDYQKECKVDGITDDNPPKKREPKKLKVQQHVADSPAFRELWKRISYHTIWSVDLDSAEVIRKAQERLPSILNQTYEPSIRTIKAIQATDDLGTEIMKKTRDYSTDISDYINAPIPDVVELISRSLAREKNRLSLTNKTIAQICNHEDAIKGILKNPVQWSSLMAKAIREVLEEISIHGLKYEVTDKEGWDPKLLIEQEKMDVYKEVIDAGPAGFYDFVAIDSEPERNFVQQELIPRSGPQGTIKGYIKLPAWFKIPTPVGSYNPDFAIIKEHDNDGSKTLYLIREIKGEKNGATQISTDERRKTESAEKHFAVSPYPKVNYKVASDGKYL